MWLLWQGLSASYTFFLKQKPSAIRKYLPDMDQVQFKPFWFTKKKCNPFAWQWPKGICPLLPDRDPESAIKSPFWLTKSNFIHFAWQGPSAICHFELVNVYVIGLLVNISQMSSKYPETSNPQFILKQVLLLESVILNMINVFLSVISLLDQAILMILNCRISYTRCYHIYNCTGPSINVQKHLFVCWYI